MSKVGAARVDCLLKACREEALLRLKAVSPVAVMTTSLH